ncbi:MAG: hypothetical protein A3D31_00665 [Candidatus Fluviicola riflensis]|nr:MAG: hypothetical protein CHH17_04880 [Candidatus Fluviicola riflensis]OGS76120.1 MAG: hypothetical protein A3D31_00665 [Candidatus Fluviicola riflensis]OGS82020.1 MAG: hypothetical protein A2724_16420 [Fluviicola sp. RIFCSPHIGHO2_01_FULL_43_53]OGS83479.1 MAG: hypothetical protein A3E30_16825 [Fluviicola sp. RIFCSPHIGHO2_12_FULL_43_24]
MLQQSFHKFAFAFLGLVFLTACENPSVKQGKSEKMEQPEVEPFIGKPDNFDYGKVENNVYSNSYFKCTMKVPKDWVIMNNEVAGKLQDKVVEKIGREHEDLKEVVDAGKINSANLLAISKFDPKTPTPSNPNFIIIAENITASPGVKTGRDYLISGRKLMQQAQINYEFLDEPKEEFINGRSFYVMNMILHTGTADVRQRYYVTISKGFAFTIIEAYQNEKEDTFMHDYVYSIKFEK